MLIIWGVNGCARVHACTVCGCACAFVCVGLCMCVSERMHVLLEALMGHEQYVCI